MAAVCGSSGIASLFSQAAFAAESDIADGKIVRFDFAGLQSMAQALAKKPWGGAPGPLPDTLANLTPQAYNSIQYDAAHSLWNGVANRQLDIQFFHVGMGFRRRVRMFSVDTTTHLAREIHFARNCLNTTMPASTRRNWKGRAISVSPVSVSLKRRNWRGAMSSPSWAPVISGR